MPAYRSSGTPRSVATKAASLRSFENEAKPSTSSTVTPASSTAFTMASSASWYSVQRVSPPHLVYSDCAIPTMAAASFMRRPRTPAARRPRAACPRRRPPSRAAGRSPRLLRIDGPLSEHHAVDRARRVRAHVAFAHVGQHALGIALERIAEAAATRVGEAEDVARAERDAAGVEAERPGHAVALEVERGAGTRIAAEESRERDRPPHAERRALEPRRLAVHREGRLHARPAAEAARAARVAPEPLVEVAHGVRLLDGLDVGVDEARAAVVAARHVDAVAVPGPAGAYRVPVHHQEGLGAVPGRQPHAGRAAGRRDALGEPARPERAGERLLEARLAELHRHQPDV